MREIRYLFIDNGGVITDNARLSPHWRRLTGEFMAPRLGGTVEAWEDANGAVIRDVIARYFDRLKAFDPIAGSVIRECHLYYLDWLRSMCSLMEIEGPADDDACTRLSLEADAWIRRQVYAPFDGAVDTVRELAGDYPLFTASDGVEFQLQMSFQTLGIVDCFQRLYGPDLINWPKSSPGYHAHIFADAGVDPAHALIIDDSPDVLRSARTTGAYTVLVSRDPAAGIDCDATIARLADLPALLRDLKG